MKVAILHTRVADGAPQDELDVLVQAEAVSQALFELGYEPVRVDFSIDLKKVTEALQAAQPEVVFNLVESVEGNGRLIHTAPAFLDHLMIPYTGAGTDALFLSSNKPLAKKLLQGWGIPTPQWFTLKDAQDNGTCVNGLCIIKAVWEHASIGLDEDSVVPVMHLHQLYHEMERRREQLVGIALLKYISLAGV